MKKVLSILCAAAVLFTVSMTAFASAPLGTNENSTVKTAASLEERSDRLSKKLEFLKFKQFLYDKKTLIRENRASNRNLVMENTQLRLDILASLKSIRENGGALAPEVQEQLKTYNGQIKETASALKETKGDIKAIIDSNKQNIEARNYEAIDTAYSQIISIQKSRNDQLQKINEVLKNIKSLIG